MSHESGGFPINYSNHRYVLELLEQYKKSPDSVDKEWAIFFQGMEFATISESTTVAPSDFQIQFLYKWVKKNGHLRAQFNPMEPVKTPFPLESIGFKKEDLSTSFPTLGILPESKAPLQEIIRRLEEVYMGPIGYEYAHVEDQNLKKWLDQTILQGIPKSENLHILQDLFKAKQFEDFLQKKFLGAKRFSIEGGESFMPMLSQILDAAADKGYTSLMMGMAHRGRLNVLCNLCKKPYKDLFHEFNADSIPSKAKGLGDVKYHKGFSSTVKTWSQKNIQVTLAPNPSHLESVDPVLLGLVKAHQMQQGGTNRVLPLLIHGDAALAGQGVVYESMQLMGINGYNVGGTVHIVINNQVGFTASPKESRSTRYCTDIAKAFGSPVIHVNAEDPIAACYAAKLAFTIRDLFGVDVFVDLNCHRLWGHNEADEPRYTNPQLYKAISSKEHVYKQFLQKVGGSLEKNEIDQFESTFIRELESAFQEKGEHAPVEEIKEPTSDSMVEHIKTAVPQEKLKKIGILMSTIPDSVKAHPKIRKIFQERADLFEKEDDPLFDWATGETLAYASLLEEGVHVRISGQDSKRGTFSHRHAVIIDQEHEGGYTPLANLSSKQAEFNVYSSALSEYGVMGYEFGYSLGFEHALVIWEAQFGDFVNGAEIIIDQYIAGCETKWDKLSGLTLFLPHGHEGMGSEHTSCRIERFLQLSALYNWRVTYPSTPAQFFHLLRRQAITKVKKPLIVATPKSMLRLPASFSPLDAFSDGFFEELLDDPDSPKHVKRILFCMGKIYYELKAIAPKNVAIIRMEQLYPFHQARASSLLEKYREAKEVYWVQEEPQNQGAWDFIRPYLEEVLGSHQTLTYVGRGKMPIPDTGFVVLFKKQQADLLKKAVEGI